MNLEIFRTKSYFLGITLVITVILYLVISNKRISHSMYRGEKIIVDKAQIPIKAIHLKDSTDIKTSITYSIFDAFKSMVPKQKFSQHIIVHLDLKGAPPRLSYLKSFLRLIKSMGATGILVEYEDMFPYTGKLKQMSALNAYSARDIKEFYRYAIDKELEFIPLLQTFGHLEFMLKLEEFSDLREIPSNPKVICPTNNNTMTILKMMIDQVISLHPGINWLHIGSDEVFHIGDCKRCQQEIINKYWSKDDLFLNHATLVGKYIASRYHITPIMWDDELRNIPLDILTASGIGKILEIMVWKYSPGIIENITTNIWNKYTLFNGVWMASAFKGAAEPNSFITDIGKRLNNNKEWIEIYQMLHSSIPFKGIALTGWQRFDHFGILCELLPQAVPSLALSIAYIKTNKADHTTITKVGDTLGCNSFLNIDLEYMEYVNECRYPGSEILTVSQKHFMLKRDIEKMLTSKFLKGWITPYNIKYNFASPEEVELGLQDLSMLLLQCESLINESRKAMIDVYDNFTINEWITQNLYPLQNELKMLQHNKLLLLSKHTWKRNPQELK